MNLRQAYLGMIKNFPGGWDAMCGALGMSRDALQNRIYENRGQSVSVETALQMQVFAGTTHFAEAVAAISGGVFVQIPQAGAVGNDELLSRFNALHAKIGLLSQKFSEYTGDDNIDKRERIDLSAIGDDIHRATQELLAVTFKVYCRAPDAVVVEDVR